jgi:hypothetical protein
METSIMARLMGPVFLAASLLVVTQASAGGAADFPKGTFIAKLGDDIWMVRYDGKGKFVVSNEKTKDFVIGSYKVAKDEVTFTDESGPGAAKEGEKTGKYKWKFEDNKLTFKKIEDKNAGREAALSVPWTLKKGKK